MLRLRFFVTDKGGKPLAGCQVAAVARCGRFKVEADGAASALGMADNRREVGNAPEDAGPLAGLIGGIVGRGLLQRASTDHGFTFVLGNTRTDRCGYGVIDLDALPQASRAVVSAAILAAALSDEGDFVLSVADGKGETSVLRGTILDLLSTDVFSLSSFEAAVNSPTIALLEAALADRVGAITIVAADDTPLGPAGQVVDPDPTDYDISPGSFVNRDNAAVGDDGCEHLLPSSLPLRQFSLFHVVVHDDGGADKDARPEKPGHVQLPSVTGKPGLDHRIRWGRILEFNQTWSSLGHSLGEVKYSLALAPGEAVKIAVIDWKRQDAGSRAGSNAASDALAHEQGVDRMLEDIVTGNVSEQQSGETFMAGLAGAMDFTIPQYGISAAGRHSIGYGMSNTRGNRDLSADAQQDVHLKTVQRSSLARTQNSTVVVQATQAESNYLATRIVANMNRGHSLSILYYEILRHLAVRTEFRRADPAVLVPVELFTFSIDLAMQYRAQLEPVLLDTKYAAGFDAMERAAAGIRQGASLPPPPPASAPPVGAGTTASATSTVATRFTIELQTGRRWDVVAGDYAGRPDTAGDFQIVAKLENDQTVTLLDHPLSGIGTETFGIMMNNLTGFPGWKFEVADTTIKKDFFGHEYQDIGRIIAAYTTPASSTITLDLKTVKGILVRWRTSFPFDGWNLKKLKVTATCGDGKSYDLVDHSYSIQPTATHHELFDPVSVDKFGQFFENTTAPYRTPSFPAAAPAAGGSGTSTAGTSTAVPAPPAAVSAVGDTELIKLLLNHLNANQYYYSANVWLQMDARERRLRLAPFAGEVLAGMSEIPFAMSGNHLAFRYSGTLPADARAKLPAKADPGKPQESIVTLPTRGVFAEAHLGHCNAAEERDITRLWNFDELPVSLLPNIETLTAGPRGTTPTITPDTMGNSPLSIQDTPTLPGPGEAIAKALELLAKPDIFRDQSTREQVADIMGKLIESAKPPALTGENVGSAWGSGKGGASGSGLSAPPLVSAGSTGSSPDEWANPFAGTSSTSDEGQSFLAEKYGNYRLTDDTDRLKLAPELASRLSGAGLSGETVDEIIAQYCKGTTTKVTRKPAPSVPRFPISLVARSAYTAGVDRPLYGNITLEFYRPGNLRSEAPVPVLIPTYRGGVGNQMASLATGQYVVSVSYRASQKSDLNFLREPQLQAIGLNADQLIQGVFDLLQRDLATDFEIPADAEGTIVSVPDRCKGLKFRLVAEMQESQYAAFELELGLEQGFTVAADGTVSFDSSKLGKVIEAIAEKLKLEEAALVGAILSLFSMKASIDVNNKSTLSGSEKVKLMFKPAILKRFALSEIA